jgi:alcohol dehydrogenase
MKALIYHEPVKRNWEEKPKPTFKNPTDAIIRITKTTIYGTELHIMKGDVTCGSWLAQNAIIKSEN